MLAPHWQTPFRLICHRGQSSVTAKQSHTISLTNKKTDTNFPYIFYTHTDFSDIIINHHAHSNLNKKPFANYDFDLKQRASTESNSIVEFIKTVRYQKETKN